MFPVCAGGARVKMSQADPAPAPLQDSTRGATKAAKGGAGSGEAPPLLKPFPEGWWSRAGRGLPLFVLTCKSRQHRSCPNSGDPDVMRLWPLREERNLPSTFVVGQLLSHV